MIHEHNHGADCTCLGCGSELRAIEQDISEVLEYEPGSFKVIRYVRPKYDCMQCNSICQASATERPIERSMAGAGLLANGLTRKYYDHLPLYRQSQIYRRVTVSASGYNDWAARSPSQTNARLTARIRESFATSDRTYGSPRVRRDLQELGRACSENRVAQRAHSGPYRVTHRTFHAAPSQSEMHSRVRVHPG